jgi:hypothetical protein
MATLEQIECDHSYSETLIHVDLEWGQKVSALVCRYCGDTKTRLPEPMRQILGLSAPAPRASRAPRNEPITIESAWLRMKKQHRELIDSALRTRAHSYSH